MAQANTFEQFMATVKPGMLDANGRFKGPDADVNYQAEGMTPQEFYAFMNQQIEDPSQMHGTGGSGATMARGNADASWIPGAVDTKAGFLGNWGPGLAMLAAPFAAAGLGAGAAAGEGAAGATAGGGAFGAAGDFGAGTYAAGAGTGEVAGGVAGAAGGASGLAGAGDMVTGAFPLDPIVPGEVPPLTPTELASIGGESGKAGFATAFNAAKGGVPFADLVKTYGPTVAKLAVAAIAGKAASDDKPSAGGSGTNIDGLISHAFGNTSSMESDFNNVFKPWLKNETTKIGARGDAGYDQIMGLSNAENPNLASYQQYVDRIGTRGYRDQQRGKAMADVQQQADIGLGSARRAAMARGVDPTKFALQANASSINTAAAKAKAASDADTTALDQWGKGAQTAAGMQVADGNYRSSLVKGANDVGRSGFDAGTKSIGLDSVYRGGINSGYTSLISPQNQVNNANTQQSNYDKEHGLSGIVNAGLATAATKWLTDDNNPIINNIFK